LPADDGIPSHEVDLGSKQVHRAPLPLAQTSRLAEQLSHHPFWVSPTHDRLGVLAVGGEDVIVFVQGSGSTGRNGFLAAVEMQKAGDVSLGLLFRTGFFKFPTKHHLFEQLNQFMVWQDGPEFGLHGAPRPLRKDVQRPVWTIPKSFRTASYRNEKARD
jgi:hypothetical protein